jgi:hypothetical protein
MDIKDFAYLLLAMMANKSKKINLLDKNIKTLSLPCSYKETIEKIIGENVGWRESFSVLIDVEEYSYNNYAWEEKFSKCLKEILKEMGKKVEYDLVYDRIEVEFKQEEIDKILEKYTDEKINNKMDHFTNLLASQCFTRSYLAMMKQIEQSKNGYVYQKNSRRK